MIWLILIPLALAAALLLAGRADGDRLVPEAKGGPHTVAPLRTPAEPDDPEDGCRKDHSDPNAPKTVESTLIISFDCRFSTMDIAEPGALGNHIYQLQAKLENGAVKGTYQVRDTGEKRPFRESHTFLGELRGIVEKFGLAQYNGHCYAVAGLPGDYGANLNVRYASGESIYACDNQDNFLPRAAMDELLQLFERGAAEVPHVLRFAVETRNGSEPLRDGYGDICYPVYRLDAEGRDALSAAVVALNEARLAGAADRIANFRSAGCGQLCDRTDAFVTRADSVVLSFYERATRRECADWNQPMTEYTAHNLDARTGKELKFSDVFRDMESLPRLLLTEFQNAYPEQTFHGDALDSIRRSVEGDDGSICFALDYSCVHIFANEYILNSEPGGQHITLSYLLNPGQIRAWYTTPGRAFIPASASHPQSP